MFKIYYIKKKVYSTYYYIRHPLEKIYRSSYISLLRYKWLVFKRKIINQLRTFLTYVWYRLKNLKSNLPPINRLTIKDAVNYCIFNSPESFKDRYCEIFDIHTDVTLRQYFFHLALNICHKANLRIYSDTRDPIRFEEIGHNTSRLVSVKSAKHGWKMEWKQVLFSPAFYCNGQLHQAYINKKEFKKGFKEYFECWQIK